MIKLKEGAIRTPLYCYLDDKLLPKTLSCRLVGFCGTCTSSAALACECSRFLLIPTGRGVLAAGMTIGGCIRRLTLHLFEKMLCQAF